MHRCCCSTKFKKIWVDYGNDNLSTNKFKGCLAYSFELFTTGAFHSFKTLAPEEVI